MSISCLARLLDATSNARKKLFVKTSQRQVEVEERVVVVHKWVNLSPIDAITVA